MEQPQDVIRETCTLIRVRAPRCKGCGRDLRPSNGFAVRVGPIYVLLEPKPSTCAHCGEENFIPKVIPNYQDAEQKLRELERDGAPPQELGDVFQALPDLHPERVAPRGEKRNPRRAR